jgi:lipid A 3-O-deacylase
MFNMELRTRGGKSAGFGFRAVAVAALFLAAGLASSCYAQSSGNEISLSGGRADDSIDVIGLRVGKPIGYWDFASCLGFEEADLEYWNAPHQYHASGDLTTIGALAGCRFMATSRISPEIGMGVRLLSHVQIVDDKYYSTAFQFQEMLGARVRLDDDGKYFAGIRARHISNGSIKRPNAGINTLLLSVGMLF